MQSEAGRLVFDSDFVNNDNPLSWDIKDWIDLNEDLEEVEEPRLENILLVGKETIELSATFDGSHIEANQMSGQTHAVLDHKEYSVLYEDVARRLYPPNLIHLCEEHSAEMIHRLRRAGNERLLSQNVPGDDRRRTPLASLNGDIASPRQGDANQVNRPAQPGSRAIPRPTVTNSPRPRGSHRQGYPYKQRDLEFKKAGVPLQTWNTSASMHFKSDKEEAAFRTPSHDGVQGNFASRTLVPKQPQKRWNGAVDPEALRQLEEMSVFMLATRGV
ncbi:hypothetical protein DXG01_006894 [Tephrocybe rancida]|nr:hypothetical protein DXG01_006894 [Tephrocybe rancida]